MTLGARGLRTARDGARQVHRYKKKLVSRTGSTDNHATSGLKFKILVDFLSIGCSVLLSDVDVIWLANPFPFLYRDTDVEGMTDGWDEPTSYGYDYGSGALRVFARNSGMFYLQVRRHDARARPSERASRGVSLSGSIPLSKRPSCASDGRVAFTLPPSVRHVAPEWPPRAPRARAPASECPPACSLLQATHESNQMMKRLARRMETEGTWDQTAYNEEQFYPASAQHATVGVSSRVMNYLCNLNSKTFFRFLREDNELLTGFRPVSVHVNYHPEKPNRMVDLHAWYYQVNSTPSPLALTPAQPQHPL